jgi:hypothetical protein
VPEKPAKPLKTNDRKKSRNHRQNSSKLVKTQRNPLIYHDLQQPFVSLLQRLQRLDLKRNLPRYTVAPRQRTSSKLVKTRQKTEKDAYLQ